MCDTENAMMSEKLSNKNSGHCDKISEITTERPITCEMCNLICQRHVSELAMTVDEANRRRLIWLSRLQLVLILLTLAVGLLTVNWQTKQIKWDNEEKLQDIYYRLQLLESRFDKEISENFWRIRSVRSVNEPLRTIDNVAILNPPARLVSGGSRQSVGLSLYSTLSRGAHVEPTAEPMDLSDEARLQDSIQPHHRESAVYDEKHENLRAEEESHYVDGEDAYDYESTARIEIREPLPDLVNPVSPSFERYVDRVTTGDMPIIPSPKLAFHRINPNRRQNNAAFTPNDRPASTKSSRLDSLARRVKAMELKILEQTKSLLGHFESYSDPSIPGHLGRFRMENRHPLKLHTLWRKSSWMKQSASNVNLTLVDGQLHVKLGGLYFVYVQVNYLGPKQKSGYEIQVNGKSRAHCVISDGGKHHGKMSTCYTGVLLHIKPGDTITIHDLESHCVSMMKADRTFFGLIRVAGGL